jgi:pyruvate,orthophosphate dikinase
MTELGGSTSHAAVVSRELGRPCVVGCGPNTVVALAGRHATVDGASGRVWEGNLTVEHAEEAASPELRKLVEWGLPLVPMRLLQPEEASADSVDLDACGDRWRTALRPGISVSGNVLETDEGIQVAMKAGVRAAVVRRRLPALLACLSVLPESTAQSLGVVASDEPEQEVPEFTLLRLVELKGRAGADVLAEALAVPVSVAQHYYVPLCEQGLCSQSGGGFYVTEQGRNHLQALLAQERARADRAAVCALYKDFRAFNAELKQIMTEWQIKPDGGMNDHNDAEYDRSVLQRLAELHARATSLLSRLPQLAPRLAAYQDRLDRAAARIAAGDRRYVARIIADSYHTVWFELHEELLSLGGLKREVEARAGELGAALAVQRDPG